MPRRAMLQLLDIGVIEGELRKIRGLRWIAESLDGEVAWNLAKRVDIGSKLKIFFGGRLYEYRAKYKYFVGAAGVEDFCDRFSGAYVFHLVVGQPDKVAKETGRLVRLVISRLLPCGNL